MLVLKRSYNESVVLMLDDKTAVVVTICKVRDGNVSLGFTAPQSIKIVRAELLTDAEREQYHFVERIDA